MTSMTLNGVLKLPHDPGRHASCVSSWIKALRDDPEELRQAARDSKLMMTVSLALEVDRPSDERALSP